MNNFKNPYDDPYSFQGYDLGIDSNPTKPNAFHSSFNHQGGMEQTEKQHDENNQTNTTKKHSIYTNHGIDNTTGSKPIIFSPPSLELARKDPFE